jgi:hypothetical protein
MTVLIAGRLRLPVTYSFQAQINLVLSDAFSSKYRNVTHKKKAFDRAVSRYRQGQIQPSRRRSGDKCAKLGDRPLSEVLQANYAKISSSQRPCLPASQPSLTLAEADACLRARVEPLPAMILKEVIKFREHTRYFFIASGHADALNPLDPGKSGISFPQENIVPEELKNLLDEVAQEEGFDERLKQEVWDDEHARNVSLPCLRK